MNAKQYLACTTAALVALPILAPQPAFAQTQSRAPEDIDFSDATYPVVITPTRLRQSLADVPAGITASTDLTLNYRATPDTQTFRNERSHHTPTFEDHLGFQLRLRLAC